MFPTFVFFLIFIRKAVKLFITSLPRQHTDYVLYMFKCFL